jgi:hemerythrin superfamily protein
MKEANGIVLARIDERLDGLLKSNDKEHKNIATSIKELIEHVNHENEAICKRVKCLEDKELVRRTQWKTLLFIISATAGMTAFIIQIVNMVL